MKQIYPIVFFFILVANKVAGDCESGWVTYKDELCIKLFPMTFLNYEETKAFCLTQGNELSRASLVMVKQEAIQDILANYTQDVFDNVWLGSRYDDQMSQFLWEDGEPLNYTNWQDGYPSNVSDSDSCIELRPRNTKSSPNAEGKWADVTCQKRNLAICQRNFPWSIGDIVDELMRLRKQHQEDIEKMSKELEATREEIMTKVVPVGSIYVEYYNQPSPGTLWPTLTWQDVTSAYAGLFFRASGSGAAGWGVNQTECAPRITQMEGKDMGSVGIPNPVAIPASGWSQFGDSGEHNDPGPSGSSRHLDGLRLYTEACEVRPKNQAIRMWKRTA